MSKNLPELGIVFHTDPECPQMVDNAMSFHIKTLEDIELPEKNPIIAQIIEKGGEQTKITAYIVGTIEPAENVIKDPEKYQLIDPEHFLKSCSSDSMVVCQSPKGKIFVHKYEEGKTNVFDSSEQIIPAVLEYASSYLARRSSKENTGKEYQKKKDTNETA